LKRKNREKKIQYIYLESGIFTANDIIQIAEHYYSKIDDNISPLILWEIGENFVYSTISLCCLIKIVTTIEQKFKRFNRPKIACFGNRACNSIDLIKAISEMIGFGWQYESFVAGKDAIRWLVSNKQDLIICDYFFNRMYLPFQKKLPFSSCHYHAEKINVDLHISPRIKNLVKKMTTN